MMHWVGQFFLLEGVPIWLACKRYRVHCKRLDFYLKNDEENRIPVKMSKVLSPKSKSTTFWPAKLAVFTSVGSLNKVSSLCPKTLRTPHYPDSFSPQEYNFPSLIKATEQWPALLTFLIVKLCFNFKMLKL